MGEERGKKKGKLQKRQQQQPSLADCLKHFLPCVVEAVPCDDIEMLGLSFVAMNSPNSNDISNSLQVRYLDE